MPVGAFHMHIFKFESWRRLVLHQQLRDEWLAPTGMMADAKGPGYDQLLAFDITMASVIQEWWEESGRQIAASDGRPVRWYFAELGAALEARLLFDSDNDGGRQRIEVVFLPWSRGQQ